MRHPLAVLLLLLQLVFATLPGDGLGLCLGGEHGALGLCSDHACEWSSVTSRSVDGPGESPTGDLDDHCDDCRGVHLTRGALEPWQPCVASSPPQRAECDRAHWHSQAYRLDRADTTRVGAQLASVHRRAPPPPPRLGLQAVRVTVLRI
jgi:Zn-finger nucleic acid-binding protein